MKTLRNLAAFNIILALAIILWGAWVRISGSGAGCGSHWPLCKGELWPSLMSAETWIELFHRLKSGVFGITVIAVFVLSRIKFPKQHPVRAAALWGIIFTITEALVGAKLVLFDLVAGNQSLERVATSALHLSNTSLLMGALVATYVWSKKEIPFSPAPWKKEGIFCLLLFLCIGITGTWAALANTLYPAGTLALGFAADFDPTSHWLVRIRIFHPFVALFLGSFLWWKVLGLSKSSYASKRTRAIATSLVPATIVIGLSTLLLLSPTWLKLTHLALSTSSMACMWGLLFMKQSPSAKD